MKKYFIALFVASLVSSSSALAQIKSSSLPPVDVKKVVLTENIAKDAYLWGYPLVRFERTKKLFTTTPGFGHAPLNTFFHARHLPTPQDRELTNPLPDTLYSSAFLDLRQQPMVLEIPQIKDRYYSLQVMDANSNNVAFISSRVHGENGGKFFITGPKYIGSTPEGFEPIHATTNFVWVLGHIAADSPTEVKIASSILKAYKLRTYKAYLGKEKSAQVPALTARATAFLDPRKISEAGVSFFDELGAALKENEPSDLEPALMERFRSIGVGAGLRPSTTLASREIKDAFVRAITSAEMDMDRAIRKELVQKRHGWNYISREDSFGDRYTLRAAMSKIYFAETNAAESLHPTTSYDLSKQRLNGNNTYQLHFAKNQLPPNKGFWSLVPYNSKTKSLVTNSLNRYALGSYSKDLILNSDGSLDIYISANEPSGKTSNWLPAPRGSFYVMLNIYRPEESVISGKYKLPRLQKVTLSPTLSLNK